MPKVRDMYANVLVEGYMYVVRWYYFEKVSLIIFHICYKCEIRIRNCLNSIFLSVFSEVEEDKNRRRHGKGNRRNEIMTGTESPVKILR